MNKQWQDIDEVREANKVIGNFWFTKDTMKFFNSYVETGIIRYRYFVSSEQARGGTRKYTIRKVEDSGAISTIGKFQQYSTLGKARRAIRKL